MKIDTETGVCVYDRERENYRTGIGEWDKKKQKMKIETETGVCVYDREREKITGKR